MEIVPILKKKGQDTQIVALKQFRAPAGEYMIELPAGLLDSNEKAIDTALRFTIPLLHLTLFRELKEETGYSGVVINESVPVRFSMAITNITSKIVVVEVWQERIFYLFQQIDGDKPENQNPKQYLEGEEQAEVIHIPFNNIMNTVNQYKSQGYGVGKKYWYYVAHLKDGKIVMMATGIQLTNDLGKLSWSQY